MAVSNGDHSNGDSSVTSETGGDMFLFQSYLDEVDDRVQELRRRALSLKGERDTVLKVLSHIKHECLKSSLSQNEFEELNSIMERLRSKCENIDIQVNTVRNTQQEEAFSQINALVEELECCSMDGNNTSCQPQAQSYLNACVSDLTTNGSVDYKFQSMILDCVIEDQKAIRQRLESLVKGSCHVDFMRGKTQRSNPDHELKRQQDCASGTTDSTDDN